MIKHISFFDNFLIHNTYLTKSISFSTRLGVRMLILMNNYAPHNRNTRLNISATIYNILCGFSSRKVFDEYVCFWIRDISFQVFFRNFSVMPNLPLEFCLFATEWTQEFGSIKKFGKKNLCPTLFAEREAETK